MILCFNTAIAEHHVALVDAAKKRVWLEPLTPQRESETILATIDSLFQKAKTAPSALTGVSALIGPGGFTSLRIGLSVANAFAHSLKIPILGLPTDEWSAYRTDAKDWVYLQTMNREEVYIKGFGRLKNDFNQEILAVASLDSSKSYPYFGPISEDQKKSLPVNFKEIKKIKSAEETWAKACKQAYSFALMQPYYGKEAKITQRKN